MSRFVSLISGIIFGVGLTVSQMINPEKVLGFLISSPFFHIFKSNKKPFFADSFSYSNNKELNKKLIIGSSLFGAGWGLVGLCPGPAIASLALLNIGSVFFVITMFIGFYISNLFETKS